MPARVECIGDVCGKLTVIAEAEPYRNPSGRLMRRVVVQCECGNKKELVLQNFRDGGTTTCGCGPQGKFKHGMVGTRTYHTWIGMRARCHDENHDAYERYGAKGVAVCERWLNGETGFQNFLEDMGERPEGRTLDRIKNHLGYFKDNCRWATNAEQYENKRVVRGADGKFTTKD